MNRTACFAAIAGLVLMSPVVAHEHATGIVKERMDAMAAMGKLMKSIGQRVKANRDFGAIRRDAEAILPLAAKIASLFPHDSNQHPSEAKRAIWQNWSDFESKAHLLEVEVGKLATTDISNPNAVATQVRVVSHACGGCHELYREKKK